MQPSPPTPPYHAEHYDLGRSNGAAPVAIALRRLQAGEAAVLATATAAMSPWTVLRTPPEHLLKLFTRDAREDGGVRLALTLDGTLGGMVVVRPNWLIGPYLNFLAVLPQYQGYGAGAAILTWFEAQARAQGSRNMWVCVAAFNGNARKLYERHGFVLATELADLIIDGAAECLLRKRL